jgi:heptosyltransferase-2
MKVRIATSRSLSAAERILIRGTNWIGDAVMTIPAVNAVRNAFPHAGISLLAKPWLAEVYRLCPSLDEIILFHDPGAHSGIMGKLRLAEELKERKFDAAILLQNAIEAAIIAWRAGIPIRAGYNSDGRGLLLTHSVQRTDAIRKVHQIEYYLEMVKALGCPSAGTDVRLTPGEAYHTLGDGVLRAHGIGGEGLLIGMAPGATYGPAKRWFPERFAAVADRLIDEFSARVIVFGSKDDRESADQVEQSARHPLTNLAGKTNLKEVIAVMARCSLFISNDSGLMHIAGALNIPTVAIFGSTNPVTTSPVGDRSVVIYKSASCSPCLKVTCPTDFRCMELISVDDVYEKSRRLLEEHILKNPPVSPF